MKKFLIVAVSSLLFAVEEPTVCNPRIEEQKVLLFYDEDPFRALSVGDFAIMGAMRLNRLDI